MIYVHLIGNANSTIFTNCCEAAILPQQTHCPVCKQEIYPGVNQTDHQRDTARWTWAYGRQKQGVPS